ncbi:hypothetical protein T459_30515 [Capsicum annuum]|uniref:Putative plant transposon protein domain-containing protein n=1 Tax=Capsicum annuum TaxID=4072 RepID=A0A2G2Y8M7_CAPAN|nr:hypothetical protein T459_30515 [Capsicum annuum]
MGQSLSHDPPHIFSAGLKHQENQRKWLVTLIEDEEPEWLNNPAEKITKTSLNSEARFWCVLIWIHLITTEGDIILGDDRAILVASLIDRTPLDFGEIIAEEIKIQLARPDAAYPFSCLITRLCEPAHVPEILGIDEEIHAKKTHNPVSKNKIWSGLRLDQDAVGATDPPVTETVSAPDVGVKSTKIIPPAPPTYLVQAGLPYEESEDNNSLEPLMTSRTRCQTSDTPSRSSSSNLKL